MMMPVISKVSKAYISSEGIPQRSASFNADDKNLTKGIAPCTWLHSMLSIEFSISFIIQAFR
jgi:hypothetical protein